MIQQLCKFTNIQYDDRMSNPKMGQYSSITGKRKEGFDKDSAFRWKNQIWPVENKLMYFLTKSSLKRFGYQ